MSPKAQRVYEFHAKIALAHETKDDTGKFPSSRGSLGPYLIRCDLEKITSPMKVPTIEMRLSKTLLKSLDHEWLVVEINRLCPMAAIPKVFERPVPLPLDEIDNRYSLEVRMDIGETRQWSPELRGDIEVILRGSAP
jgi:hypothetical protein